MTPEAGRMASYAIALVTAASTREAAVLKSVADDIDQFTLSELVDLIGVLAGFCYVLGHQLEEATGVDLIAAIGSQIASQPLEES